MILINLSPFFQDAAAAHTKNGAIGETGSFSAQAQSTFVPPALAQTVMSVTDFHPQHQPPPQMGPQNLGPQKPPKEFADESSSMSGGEGMITTTNVDHHHPNVRTIFFTNGILLPKLF